MIKRLIKRISGIKAFLFANPNSYLLVVSLATAAVFAAWLLSSGETVSFVYNEF